MRSAACIILIAGSSLSLAQSTPQANSLPATASKKSVKDTSPPTVGRSKGDLTYAPVFYPRIVELTPEELAAVRTSAVKHAVTFHSAEAERNMAAAEIHKLNLQQRIASDVGDEWYRQHSQQVLATQQFYAQVILWVVLSIVGVAIALTVYQFVKDSALAERSARLLLGKQSRSSLNVRSSEKMPDDPELVKALAIIAAHNPDPSISAAEVWRVVRSPSTFSLSPTGVQLGSQVVGLVVLAFALGFFYLYLEKVYPITVASDPSASYAPPPASAVEVQPTDHSTARK